MRGAVALAASLHHRRWCCCGLGLADVLEGLIEGGGEIGGEGGGGALLLEPGGGGGIGDVLQRGEDGLAEVGVGVAGAVGGADEAFQGVGGADAGEGEDGGVLEGQLRGSGEVA